MQMSTTWQNSGPFLYPAKYGITPCMSTRAAEAASAAEIRRSPVSGQRRALALPVGMHLDCLPAVSPADARACSRGKRGPLGPSPLSPFPLSPRPVGSFPLSPLPLSPLPLGPFYSRSGPNRSVAATAACEP